MVKLILSEGMLELLLISFLDRKNSMSLSSVSLDRLPLSSSGCLITQNNDKIPFSHSESLCSISLNVVELNSEYFFGLSWC